MSATIIPLCNPERNKISETVDSALSETIYTNVSSLTAEKISPASGTNRDNTKANIQLNDLDKDIISTPVERIYPHIFDDAVETGQARINLLSALKDAQSALESFGEADITSISTRITLIASTMSNTHRLTEFNESLGAVVSFLRRAMLSASAADITRPALNVLVHVLQNISSNPMIDLDDAGELVEKLSDEGWQGEYGFADAIVAALFDDLDTDTDADAQLGIFEDVQD